MKLGHDFIDNREITLTADAIARHLYVSGMSGAGKSTLIESAVLDLIYRGYGVMFIDPHGDSVEKVADRIPQEHISRTTYWEPFDLSHTIGYNPLFLKDTSDIEKSLLTERVLAAISYVFGISDRHDRNFYDEMSLKILRNTIRLLLDNRLSLIDLSRCLTDMSFRTELLENCTLAHVTGFWEWEYNRWSEKQRVEYTASLLNKADEFLSNPIIANILGSHSLTLSRCMDEGKVVLVNLNRGRIGSSTSALLGSLLTAGLSGAALARGKNRRPFVLIIDEFAPFANAAFREILSEARKFGLSLVLAHQYEKQLPPYLINAILGNTSTLIIFRTADAKLLAEELDERNPQRLRRLPNYHALVRTLENKAPGDTHELVTEDLSPSLGSLQRVREWTRNRT